MREENSVHIHDDIYLSRDRYQWIVRRRYVSGKNGDAAFTDLGFYPHLSMAAQAIANYWAVETPANDLNELTRAFERLESAVYALLEQRTHERARARTH